MSKWYEIPSRDISLDEENQQVDLLVCDDYSGNVYAILTFDQVEWLYGKISKANKPSPRPA